MALHLYCNKGLAKSFALTQDAGPSGSTFACTSRCFRKHAWMGSGYIEEDNHEEEEDL